MSKLSFDQKIRRLNLINWAKDEKIYMTRVGFVTVAIMPTCKGGAYVSWSLCSKNEKFSRKMGELIALDRMAEGQSLPIKTNGEDLDFVAHCMAETVDF